MCRRLPASLLALLLLPPASAAEERTRVEYVLVDVVARDRGNRLVTDLTLDDFVVTDDGRKVVLESLDILDLRRQVLESGTAPVVSEVSYLPGDDPPRSQVLLVLDVPPEGSGPALQALRWVDRYLENTAALQGVEYGLHSIPGGRLMEGFSEDPAVIRGKLAAFRPELRVAPGSRAGAGPTSEGLFVLERRFCDCLGGLRGVALWNCVQMELHPFVQLEAAHTELVLRELARMPSWFTDPNAARSVVLVSSGFSMRPGKAAIRLAQRYLPRFPLPPPPRPLAPLPGVAPPPMEEMGPDPAAAAIPYPVSMRFDEEYLAVLDAFARARITFYGIDMFLFGIEETRQFDMTIDDWCPRPISVYRQYRWEHQDGPTDLSRQTGGMFALDLWPVRPQIEGDRFVYVLGYRSPPGEPGQFRKIKVGCRRGSVKLVHRQGYVS